MFEIISEPVSFLVYLKPQCSATNCNLGPLSANSSGITVNVSKGLGHNIWHDKPALDIVQLNMTKNSRLGITIVYENNINRNLKYCFCCQTLCTAQWGKSLMETNDTHKIMSILYVFILNEIKIVQKHRVHKSVLCVL